MGGFRKVNENIPNMIFGVSQQPYTMRLNAQCEESINTLPSVSKGLTERPGCRLGGVSTYADLLPENTRYGVVTYLHREQDTEKLFLFVASDGWVHVFETDNELSTFTQKEVVFTASREYLGCGTVDPAQCLQMLSIGDRVLLRNRKKLTKALETENPYTYWKPSIVFVKQASFQTEYRLRVAYNGVSRTVSYTTPPSVEYDANDNQIANTISTDQILAELIAPFVDDDTFSGNVVFHQTGAVAYIRPLSLEELALTVTVSDTQAGTHIKVFQRAVSDITDLPTLCIPGITVKVAGSEDTNYDDYYVRFEDLSGNSTFPNGVAVADTMPVSGVWRESTDLLKTETNNVIAGDPDEGAFNLTTMPHSMVYDKDSDIWYFETTPFNPRWVGSRSSCGYPSFVDSPINDMFVFENRLGFVAQNSIVLSATDDFMSFYRSTMLTLPDSDPVDIITAGDSQYRTNYGVPFNSALVIFCESRQYIIDCEDDFLTPSNASTQLLTEFASDKDVKGISSGRNIFFVNPQAGNTAVYELFVTDTDAALTDTTEITSHIPQYIGDDVSVLACCPNQSTLLLKRERDSDIYVYRYFWNGNEKVQSAWCRWEMDPGLDVRGITTKDSYVVLICRDALGGIVILSADISPKYDTDSGDYAPCLDAYMQSEDVTVELGSDGYTYFDLYPLSLDHTAYTLVDRTTGLAHSLEMCTVSSTDGLSFTGEALRIKGDFSTKSCHIGVPYKMTHQFSTLVTKSEKATQSGSNVADSRGRVQVRSMQLHYEDTGHFEVTVTPKDRTPIVHKFRGHKSNTGFSKVGHLDLSSGTFVFPVMCRNTDVEITVTNDTPYPCTLIAADWEGYHAAKR